MTTDDLPLCVGVFKPARAGEKRLGDGLGLCGVVERDVALLFSATRSCAASKSDIFEPGSLGTQIVEKRHKAIGLAVLNLTPTHGWSL